MDFLRKSNDKRKIFGERELKIIEKQLQGINLTQSEKNRLSRDIRKKFQFIREVSKFEDEFKLRKGSEVKKLADESKQIILSSEYFPKIKKIALFGSAVENKLTFRSDIDIAVFFDRITKKEALKFRKKMLGSLPDKIDIQVFNTLPEKIKKEILKNHKTLYKR